MPNKIVYQPGQRLHEKSMMVFVERTAGRKARFLCDCGNEKITDIKSVKAGITKSCGCLVGQSHGMTGHPLFNVYRSIKNRCYNKKEPCYKRYGGRGIKLSDEFLSDYMVFHEYCISLGWKEGLQIDRIDNDSGYYRGNIRFVSAKQNARNTRNSKYWFVNGVRYDSATQAAKNTGYTMNQIIIKCNRGDQGFMSKLKYN